MSGPTTLSGQVLSATTWNALLLPARFLVALVASVVYYRMLSLEQVGLLFLITSLAATLGFNADLGIERTLPRFLLEVEQRSGRDGVGLLIRRVIRAKLLILAVFVLALFALQGPLSRYVAARERSAAATLDARATTLDADPDTAEDAARLRDQSAAKLRLADQIERQAPLFMSVVAAMLFFGALYDVYMKVLTAYFKQRAWNVIGIVVTLLQPVLVTTFILAGWSVAGVLLAIGLTPAVAVLLAWAQAHRAIAELPHAPAGTRLVPGLRARFARYAGVSYLVQLTTWLSDVEVVVFLAAALLGLEQVALLGFAYKFARDSVNYLWTPFTGVTTPVLARVHQRNDVGALREAHASLTRMVWLLLFPAGAGLLLMSPWLVGVLYPKYAAGRSLILVFLVATLTEALLSVSQATLMVTERYAPLLLSRLFAVSGLPLAFLLLPRLGATGVALGIGLARLAAALLSFALARRALGLTLPVGFSVRVALASAFFVAILTPLLLTLEPAPLLRGTLATLRTLLPLLGLAGLGALLYWLALRWLGGLDESDRRRLDELRVPLAGVLGRYL
jgi:O-antigen/teichoic acid export membrane protein